MSQKKLTSKQELKVLQDEIDRIQESGLSEDFRYRCQQLRPKLDALEPEIVKQSHLAKEKDHEWMKWLIVIAAGVFSVMRPSQILCNRRLD